MSSEASDRARAARKLFPLVAKRVDSLPALPAVLLRVSDLLAGEDRTAAEVAETVRLDPAFAAKILRVVNSPFYGLDHRVSTLSHAIAVLGLPAVRAIVAGLPLAGAEAGAAGNAALGRHCLAVAAAAEEVARAVEYDLPEEAAVAGLLHDLGQIVLSTFAPADAVQAVRECGLAGRQAAEYERRLLGMDHGQVGALVAEEWNLPRILKDVIQFHHEPPERLSTLPARNRMLSGIVSTADQICFAAGLGRRPPPDAPPGGEIVVCDEVRLEREQAAAALAAARRALDHQAERLGLGGGDFAAAAAAFDPAARAELLRRRAPRPLAERMGLVTRALGDLRALPTEEEVLRAATRLARTALDMDRALYLRHDPDESRLLGRCIEDDTRLAVRPESIDLPLDPEGLVGAALRDGVPVRVDNWTTDGPLLALLSQAEVLAAPVPARSQPLGILCVDSFLRNREFTDEDLELLGLIAAGAGVAAQNVALEVEAERLHRLAARDELTGVCNRRSLMEMLQKEIDRARRYQSPLSVVMIDIDHFKDFNDSYGHQAGDTVLAEMGQLIVAASREVDVIGRYGGEEFLIVLPETHVDQAIVYAERIRKVVDDLGARHRLTWPACPLTISVGVTSLAAGDDDLEEVVRRVDRALYAAKARGRNRVCVD